MKKVLGDITADSEKQFVISVAQEIVEELPKGKVDFLAQWMNTEADLLFD